MANSTIESLLDLVEEGGNLCNQTQPSIFMVPRIYRDQNPSCFDPQVVSIGPLHRGHKNVQENEWLKGVYMHELLARLDSPPQETLERCVSKVNSSINKIKLFYGGMKNFHDFDVAKMMVTDACFILEAIQKSIEGKYKFSVTFTIVNIFTDLLLIENQIPFFVLQDIFDLTVIKIQQINSLVTLLLDNVFDKFKLLKVQVKIDNNGIDVYKIKHIVEILHNSYRPELLPEYGSLIPLEGNHSVVKLDLAGVKFKPNQGTNMLMTIENDSYGWLPIFQSIRKPTLRMPVLIIEDRTELVLRNLIAYEQSSPNLDDYYFTSLAYSMDMLVDSKEDVVKLVESKVILNYLGSNEDAANMINSICNKVNVIKFLYESEFNELDTYYNSYWPKHMAWLKRTYFNSPWSVIALVVGILLFALTATQTIFAIMAA